MRGGFGGKASNGFPLAPIAMRMSSADAIVRSRGEMRCVRWGAELHIGGIDGGARAFSAPPWTTPSPPTTASEGDPPNFAVTARIAPRATSANPSEATARQPSWSTSGAGQNGRRSPVAGHVAQRPHRGRGSPGRAAARGPVVGRDRPRARHPPHLPASPVPP